MTKLQKRFHKYFKDCPAVAKHMNWIDDVLEDSNVKRQKK
jgi:hypothetical protein